MSRTAHHVPPAHSGMAGTGRTHAAVTLTDLRYSVADLREASRRGRCPRPTAIQRKIAVYCHGRRVLGDRGISVSAAIEERRARQRLRRQVGALRQFIGAEGRFVLDDHDDLEIVPARHRHNAVWQA